MTHTVETTAPHYQPHPPHESSPLTSPHNPSSPDRSQPRDRLSQRLRAQPPLVNRPGPNTAFIDQITPERLIAHERNNDSRYPGT